MPFGYGEDEDKDGEDRMAYSRKWIVACYRIKIMAISSSSSPFLLENGACSEAAASN